MSSKQVPTLKMKSSEFITISACTMMLTALGIDIMLPVFSEVRKHFGLPQDSTVPSQIIGFFFMGQVAQIIFGILSDRFGRLAILRLGFPLYIIGGVGAAFSPNLTIMFAARFVAGVGASAVLMTTIAGVRDRYVGDEMARIMSLIFTIFLFTPVIAPFLGMAILSVSSWQMVFLTPPLFAVVIFAWSLRLEESLSSDKRADLNVRIVIANIKQVIKNSSFIRYTTIATLLFTALSSYVASSEYIVGEIYERPELFAWIFAGIGLGMALFSFVNSRLSIIYGARRTIRFMVLAYALTTVVLLVCTLTMGDPPDIRLFFLAIAFLMALNLAIEPNSSALAMEPMGNMAGLASSIYGTLFFFIGATLGSVISYLTAQSVLPLVFSYFIIGLAIVVLAFTDRQPKNN